MEDDINTNSKWDKNRIDTLRQSQGIEVNELAEALGVSRGVIFKARKDGRIQPSTKKLLEIIEKHSINYVVISQKDLLIIYQLLSRIKRFMYDLNTETRTILDYAIDRFNDKL